jgi:iron-sulfur cluster repair protein YtfE (RIC family)
MKQSIASLLEDDHESLAQLLAELDAELAEPNIARAFELLDLFWARLAVHIRAENMHLFPAIANASASLFTGKSSLPTSEEAHNLLLRLRSDHDFFMKELAQALKVIREIADNQEAGATVIEDVRQRLIIIGKRLEVHNQLEERRLYSWPVMIFDEAKVVRLLERLRHELENLPPRFG